MKMKILLLAADIFDEKKRCSGLYSRLAALLPQVEIFFYASPDARQADFPSNVRPLTLPEEAVPLFQLQEHITAGTLANDGLLPGMLRSWLDSALTAASGLDFDLIEIPDCLPLGAMLRPALTKHTIQYRKIVAALHGRLSEALETAWTPLEAQNIRWLENTQFRAPDGADAAYTLVESRRAEWATAHKTPCFTVSPLPFITPARLTSLRAQDSERPSLYFAGGPEKLEGGDLFFELTRWLPSALYDVCTCLGRNVANEAAWTHPRRTAALRELSPVFLADTPATRADAYKSPALFLQTSRGGFSLAALEALFSGCPTALSDQDGASDYLDKHHPGIPYIKIRMDRFYHCLKDIEPVLANYQKYRSLLQNALAQEEIPGSSADMLRMYQDMLALEGDDVRTSRSCGESIPQALAAPMVTTRRKSEDRTLEKHFQTFTEMLAAYQRMPEHSLAACTDKVAALHGLYQHTNLYTLSRLTPERANEPCPDDPRFFKGSLFACNYWQELARLQRIRGDEASAACFELRCIRLLGRDHFGTLEQACRTLERTGFAYSAAMARLLYTPGDERERARAIRAEIENRRIEFQDTYEEPYECVVDARGSETPLLSIVVSLYNAERQLDQFLTCLSRQTLARRGPVELILQDSHSTDNSYALIEKYMRSSPLQIVYARAPQRETINMSWNRGIKMARAPYVTLPGSDEMFYPDGLEKLYDAIAADESLDWVMSGQLQVGVNDYGVLDRHISLYDYSDAKQDLIYNDFRYFRWIGGIYRTALHKQCGYYAHHLLGGCQEFTYRIMRDSHGLFLKDTTAVYWDYPQSRATSSIPYADELHAYYYLEIYRTARAVAFDWEARQDEEILEQIRTSLGFRRAVCRHISTDFVYARNLAVFLASRSPSEYCLQTATLTEDLVATARSSLLLPLGTGKNLSILMSHYIDLVKQLDMLNDRICKYFSLKNSFVFSLYNEYMYQRFTAFIVDNFSSETIVFRH